MRQYLHRSSTVTRLLQPQRSMPGMHRQQRGQMAGQHLPKATRETVETPRAPGSESNFTGLPKNPLDIPVTTPVSSKQMQEHIDMVRKDFRLVFKDIMDRDHFEGRLYFRDPMTRCNHFLTYQFVVQFLRFFLAPIYELHEIRQVGEQEILVKWSWTMNFWWNRFTPFKLVWDPRFAFTGLTVLGYNPDTGKWNKHVDSWDAIKKNEFFSLEGFIFAFSQMAQVSKPPNRLTPEFQIYKKYKGWEIRRYRPFITAEIALKDLQASKDAVGAGPGIKEEAARAQRQKAESLLERYLALGNEREEFFELTTPLFITQDEVFSLMVPGYKRVEDMPKPYKSELIKLRQHQEGFCAACNFSGTPSQEDLETRAKFLHKSLQQEGSKPSSDIWTFLRYNKQDRLSAKGPFRRNDLLIPLQADSVDLWRGVDWDFVERTIKQPVT